MLAIVEPGIGKTLRELRFEQLGQIASPAWSPDGKRLAFVGLAGGWSDLYVYDLASASLARLTRDGFGDLHPAWSPDGRSIVFATDRFSTDLDALRL
ncbi:MAG TPA: DPP IV N-terminal domain-containing protein, partial [Dermatophilaceae bacterium]|nr:DPP IV N-terminal domain-containing protein [Dermatophilaceae bacterium]